MTNAETMLNNPVWHALTHQQAYLALGDNLARCYPRDMAPFAAVAAYDENAFRSLAALIAPNEVAVLIGHPTHQLTHQFELVLENTWQRVNELSLVQMVYEGPIIKSTETMAATRLLSHADVPAMLKLVELTHPGPFLQRTIELGRYLSIWQDGQLAAMAGERFHLPGYREISAVCTHPTFQRRGHSKQLIRQLIHEIQHEGDIPFLHVISENKGAQALYETLGFKRRATFPLLVLRRNAHEVPAYQSQS